jgi:hypothetical protein
VALLIQGGVASLFVLGGLLGSDVTAGYLVLLDTTIIVYFIPYIYLFGAYLELGRRSSLARHSPLAGWMGLATVAISIALASVPAESSARLWLFEAKLWGGVAAFMGLGLWLALRRGPSE